MTVNAAVYVRVSSQEQAKEGYSIGEQTERLTKYCDAMGWTIYKIYTDPGFSGGDTNRPGLQSMLKDIKRYKINKVVVYRLDRLSRSQKDTLNLIEDEFLAHSVDFISMSENFDTSTPFGKAMVGILAVFAQLEREQIKERMIMGRVARAKEGKWYGGNKPPIGYDYINGELVINEYEALQIREAFELAADNIAPFTITKIFNSKGYTTKYGKWDHVTLSNNLRYKYPLGYAGYNGSWNKGTHEAIISQELYDQVQKIMDEKSQNYHSHRAHGKITSYLGGLIICAHCGGKYSKFTNRYTRKNGKLYINEYFICNSRSRRNPRCIKAPSCNNKNWRVDELTELVFGEIRSLSKDPNYIYEMKNTDVTDNRTEVIQAEIDKIDDQISKLMDLYLMDGISKDSVQEKLVALNDQSHKLTEELEAINAEKNNKLTQEEAHDLAANFSDILSRSDFNEIRTLLCKLIDYIVIDNENIDIHWNF